MKENGEVDDIMFYQKLDYLMRLTNMSNTALAKQMNVVPSYISKIRSGKRPMPKNENFMVQMCACFAPKLTGELLTDFASVVGESFASDLRYTQLESMLSAWLKDDSAATGASYFLSLPKNNLLPSTVAYTGESGLRTAFTRILGLLDGCTAGEKVYMFSEYALGVLLAEHSFFQLFKEKIHAAIERGVRFVIVNVVDKSPQYFIDSADVFTPYLAGRGVDVYFYPHFVDHLFQHTMFILCGKAAISGFCHSENVGGLVTAVYTSTEEVQAQEMMFEQFLKRCKKYNNKFSNREKAVFEVHLTGLFSRKKDYTTLTAIPTAITFPFNEFEHVVHSKTLHDYTLTLYENLESCVYYEQFCLPDPELVRQGAIFIPLTELSVEDNVVYTPEMFRAHLQNILTIAGKYNNYQPRVRKDRSIPYNVYAKTNTRVVVGRWEEASYCLLPARVSSKYMDYIQFLEARGECYDRETSLEIIADYMEQL